MRKKLLKFMIIMAALSVTACGQQEEAVQEENKTAEVAPAQEKAPEEEVQEEKEEAPATNEEPKSLEERAFMEFEAENLEGETVTQDIFKDKKLTMINIWGTFCGPCIEEMPFLGELNQEYADKDFQIVGVVADSLDQDMNIDPAQVEKAQEMVKETGASYLHILPSKELVEKKLVYTQMIPETIFVDSTGQQIGDLVIGSKDKAGWSAIIDEKLAEVQ